MYCSNYTLKSEQKLITNKLSALISDPIIISSDLTTSEALSANNYDDLANTKLNINGNSYTNI